MTNASFFNVMPSVGLQPITFGMTGDEVKALPILGPALRSFENWDGSFIEDRGVDLPTVSYRNGRVSFMSAGSPMTSLVFADVNLITDPPLAVLQAFQQAQGFAPFHQLGSVYFAGLSLTLDGYFFADEDRLFDPDSGEQDDRTIGMYPSGGLAPLADAPRTEISFL